MYAVLFTLLQKQLVHLVLIEPKGSKEQDIYVNQLLIDEGHAIASPEVNSSSSSKRVLTSKEVLNKLAKKM